MKELEERILKDGIVLEGDVLSVGGFLNQQIDTGLLSRMADEIKREFSDEPVTKVLTVEASGIAIAIAAATVFGVPAVFAKKSRTSNVVGEVYSARVHSFTHGTDYLMTVPKRYLAPEDHVLIVDDFLANGEALQGMISIVGQSGATLAGAAVEIEKGFQGGGDRIRSTGVRVFSLAVLDSMNQGVLTFRPSHS